MTDVNLVTWNMTRKCNFRCEYCYFPHDQTQVTSPLSLDSVLGFLDGTGKSWVVGMTGGEPLIYPGIVEICRGLTENHKIEIDTNLSLSKKVRTLAETIDPSRVVDIYAALHIEERERRGGVGDFVDNVHLLLNKGFHVSVNYVIHPSLIERYPADREFFQAQGIRLIPRPFKGVHEGILYPTGYSPEAKAFFAHKKRAGKKMVFNFKGLPCEAGRRLVRLEPDGSVLRCSGDRTGLGNILTGVDLYDGPKACRVSRCPCFGPDYVILKEPARDFMTGLERLVTDRTDQAREYFQKAADASVQASNALNNLGVLSWQEGNREAAGRLFGRALEIHPFNKVYVINNAAYLAGQGRAERAAEICSAFLQKHEDGEVADLLAAVSQGRPGPEPGRFCVDIISADTPQDVFAAG